MKGEPRNLYKEMMALRELVDDAVLGRSIVCCRSSTVPPRRWNAITDRADASLPTRLTQAAANG